MLQISNKQYISKFGLRIIIGLAAYGYIFYKLYSFSALNTFVPDFKFIIYSLAACVLMPFNWLAEAAKWQLLIKPLSTITLKRSVAGVLIGLSGGLLTPNRWGELPARVQVLPHGQRIQALLLSGIGSLFQASVTLIFGIPGAFLLHQKLNFELPISNYSWVQFLIFSIFSILAAYFLFRYVWLKTKNNAAVNFWQLLNSKLKSTFENLKQYKAETIALVYLFSIIRYIIFGLQFWFLLFACNLELNFFEAATAISTYYFVLHFIPVMPGTEPGIRAAGAIAIFSIYSANTAALATVALSIWIINLAIPALLGNYLIIKN